MLLYFLSSLNLVFLIEFNNMYNIVEMLFHYKFIVIDTTFFAECVHRLVACKHFYAQIKISETKSHYIYYCLQFDYLHALN